MKRRALIIGCGVAGLVCAELLARKEWEVVLVGTPPRAGPVLVLNNETCGLLQHIWQAGDSLLAGGHVLNARTIRWGVDATETVMAQRAIAIRSEVLVDQLLERLVGGNARRVLVDERGTHWHDLPNCAARRELAHEFDWVVDADGRGSHVASTLAAVQRGAYGHRHVIAVEAELAEDSEREVCWIETVPDGWIFVAPLGHERAMLQAMVPRRPSDPLSTLAALIEETRTIKTCVAHISACAAIFNACPQKLEPLCGPGWIAVGDAAVACDPICGDGVGYATRGALLAAAVIEGVAGGVSRDVLLAHYALRLNTAFYAHLKACLRYYVNGFSSPAWQSETRLMEHGLARKADQVPTGEQFAYGLQGFGLAPLASPVPAGPVRIHSVAKHVNDGIG